MVWFNGVSHSISMNSPLNNNFIINSAFSITSQYTNFMTWKLWFNSSTHFSKEYTSNCHNADDYCELSGRVCIHADSENYINHCMLIHVSEKSQGHTADSITFQHIFIFRLSVSFWKLCMTAASYRWTCYKNILVNGRVGSINAI